MLSIILPAKNEAQNLPSLIGKLRGSYPSAEIIVVDDGSSDSTARIGREAGTKVISHRYSMGNGAAIKSGARAASGEVLVFMDADGQHDPADVARLVERLEEGYDMVVGARASHSQANLRRAFGNALYNRIASWMTGYRVEDLTSGFRAVRARKFRQFLYLLPNGFSYPTTITMAFFRSGYAVGYVPIKARQRQGDGKSSVRLLKDGIRFFVIILKIGALFSPMRLFLPVSACFFVLGAVYYTYTYLTAGRLTNMTALLMIAAMLTFLIGIVSEQVSALHYKDTERDQAPMGRPIATDEQASAESRNTTPLVDQNPAAWQRASRSKY